MADDTTNQTPDTCSHNCGSCSASCGERTAPSKLVPNSVSSFKKVIGVVSGKGGVGKTSVTCLLASELMRAGKKVGIMDADVTGPSIPKAFGAKGPLCADQNGMNPGIGAEGVEIISTNLLLPQDDMPVAWRGPVVTGILTQFFNQVNWGDLDYLLIDSGHERHAAYGIPADAPRRYRHRFCSAGTCRHDCRQSGESCSGDGRERARPCREHGLL